MTAVLAAVGVDRFRLGAVLLMEALLLSLLPALLLVLSLALLLVAGGAEPLVLSGAQLPLLSPTLLAVLSGAFLLGLTATNLKLNSALYLVNYNQIRAGQNCYYLQLSKQFPN